MRSRAKKKRILSDINITPFTDVVLVLLVIFMIATPLLYRGNFKINPPEAKTAQPERTPATLRIEVDARGEVLIGGGVFTLPADETGIKSAIAVFLRASPDATLLVDGDRDAKYDYVVKVVDIANSLGAKRIMLGTLLKRE